MDDDQVSKNAGETPKEASEPDQELIESIKNKLPKEPIEPEVFARILAAERLAVQTNESFHYRGPLPPPDMLAGYEQVKHGFADRIIKIAENEQNHRQEMEKIYAQSSEHQLDRNTTLSFRGQLFAFVIAMTAVCGGIYLIANDKSAAGLTAIIAALVALVAVFIVGKILESQEFEEESEHPTNTEEES